MKWHFLAELEMKGFQFKKKLYSFIERYICMGFSYFVYFFIDIWMKKPLVFKLEIFQNITILEICLVLSSYYIDN